MKAKKLTKETILNVALYDRKFPDFRVGDCVKIGQRVSEGDKERIQYFEGDVIGMHNNGIASTFTVRRIGANSVSVERIFPYYSPLITEITLVRKGDVRRAKLYYMRNRVGKAARVSEMVMTSEQRARAAEGAEVKTNSPEAA